MAKKLPQQYISRFYHNKTNSARSKRIGFELSKEDVKSLLHVERCAYTGLIMTHTGSNNVRKPTDLTLERVDSSKPYTKENTIAVCYAANAAKSVFESHFGKDANSAILAMGETIKAQGKVGGNLSLVQRGVKWLAIKAGVV